MHPHDVSDPPILYGSPQTVLHVLGLTNATAATRTSPAGPSASPWELVAALAPLVFAAAVILVQVLRNVLPRPPRWAINFVKEDVPYGTTESKRQRTCSSRGILLAALSLAGLGLQASLLRERADDLLGQLNLAAWATALVSLAFVHSQTASMSAFMIYTTLLCSEVALIFFHPFKATNDYLFSALKPCLALLSLVIIVNAPLRPRNWSSKGIAAVFALPDPKLRSPEDNITLWQWMTVSWLAPLLSLGKQRQLNEDDVWFLGYEFHHRKLHNAFRDLRGSVLRRLIVANGLDLMIVSILGVFVVAAKGLDPVLLKLLLHVIEDPSEPRKAALGFALVILAVRLFEGQLNVFALWYGRRCYERSRGEMITMLYEKTLSRKLVPSQVDNGTPTVESESTSQASKTYFARLLDRVSGFFRREKQAKTTKISEKPASSGKILNLMRNDVYEVSQRFWQFNDLVMIPLQAIVVLFLLWQMLGEASLIAVLMLIASNSIAAGIARIQLKWEKRRRSATDERLQIASQFVEAIRHLRWYGWQGEWLAKIIEKRQNELNLIWKTRVWQLWMQVVINGARSMFPVLTFYAFTVITGTPLRVEIAFPALNLFQMLDESVRQLPNLITVLINAKVAMDRIQHFMDEPDKPERSEDTEPDQPITIHQASFAWPGSSSPILKDVSLSLPTGMTVIGGKVGAGKTSLLLGLLGELDLVTGSIAQDGRTVGYCEQRPWLQSMSIRENILFHSPYDEVRYREVLEACMLIPDLAGFKHGDLSNIGENGIGLSGGQKARVALARALYSPARVLLLDDPLSSLDHQTAESIVQNCFAGPLAKGRILVLATHRLDLCRSYALQYVEIENGTARVRPVEDLPFLPSSTPAQSQSEQEDKANDKQAGDAIPDKFIEDEHRAHGGIPFFVYWTYVKAGRLSCWVVLALVLTGFRFFSIARQWFLKEWGESYDRPGFFGRWPSPTDDISPWVLGFFLISVCMVLLRIVAEATLILIAYFAGQELFKRAVQRIAQATFRYYDVTPVGRLMNRLTSDMGMVDGQISMQFQILAMLLVTWISSLAVLASIAPLFLLIAAFLVAGIAMIFLHFLPTSQSLRRLETTSLSPLISDFGALVDGLTTVRAFCTQYQFQSRVIDVTDNFQRMDHFYWSLQAWLTYRIDVASAAVIFLLTVLGLYSSVSAGLLAFALVNASQFVMSTHEVCRLYGQLQMDFVSVERIVELLQLKQEPPGDVDPPAVWPSSGGDIVFDHVTARYAEHLDPALRDLSFRIKGGSTTVIVGRTGSGKSTVAASLLATIAPESGTITIDGIDIARVNKQALRSRVTFLAQDPILFPGTLRQNLDPMNEHSDEDCEHVLEKVRESASWTLNTHVDSNGRNFSQGQRQLIGLARAILRRSAIVILDEATASIDMATANKIQDLFREEMQQSTVVTIAHRPEAVKDATSCIVIGNGELIEHRSISSTS